MNEQTNGQTTDSYRNVNRYLGQDYRYAPTYIRPRAPTTGDIKPKEQQGHYPVTSFWSYPAQQKLWALVNITNNLANWVLISSGSSGPLLTITGDDNIAVSPVAGNINLRGIVSGNALFAKPVFTENIGAGNELISVQVGAAIASTNVNRTGLLALNSTQFTVDGNGFASLIGGTGPALQGLSDDVNTFVSPAGSPEKIQLVGHVVEQGATKFSTVVAGTNLININPMSSYRWIVDPLGFNGTHTTIASAITSATSGDSIFIMPGTYTENLTMKAGINLVGTMCATSNVVTIIIGNITCSYNGDSSITNILLITNGAAFLTVNGANNTSVRFTNCWLDASNSTGIVASSSGGSQIEINDCYGSIDIAGIAFFSSSNSINFVNSIIFNFGASTTASTLTAGSFSSFGSSLSIPIAFSSSANMSSKFCEFNVTNISSNALTFSNSSTGIFLNSSIVANAGVCITTSSSTTIPILNTVLTANGTNVLSGTGAITIAGNSFGGSATGIANSGTINGIQSYTGTGAPTLQAPMGSIYYRKDGSSASTRAYINTNGSTTWTNIVTAA